MGSANVKKLHFHLLERALWEGSAGGKTRVQGRGRDRGIPLEVIEDGVKT